MRWLGHVDDMPTLLAGCHIVCLPSYREGLPKALLEACAAGRPIVATQVPGCQDVVSAGVNGLLVPARNARGPRGSARDPGPAQSLESVDGRAGS